MGGALGFASKIDSTIICLWIILKCIFSRSAIYLTLLLNSKIKYRHETLHDICYQTEIVHEYNLYLLCKDSRIQALRYWSLINSVVVNKIIYLRQLQEYDFLLQYILHFSQNVIKVWNSRYVISVITCHGARLSIRY